MVFVSEVDALKAAEGVGNAIIGDGAVQERNHLLVVFYGVVDFTGSAPVGSVQRMRLVDCDGRRLVGVPIQ